MNIELDVVDAAFLYRDALKENNAELLIPLKDCKIFYVPNMPHSHRSQWTEANLFIYYADLSGIDDILCVSNASNGVRRGLYFRVVKNYNDLEEVLMIEARNNLQYSSQLQLPYYIEIESKMLLKVLNLLIFI